MNVVSIDKPTINQMPIVSFPGRIHTIYTASQVPSAVIALRSASIVGFDTETRPSFKRGERHKVSLLQLSSDRGLSTTDDFHQLARVCDIHPAGFIELQQMVKQFGIADMSLQKIYAIIFQQKISKGQQLSNWEAPQLSEAQKRYAAIDAWACLRIYRHLHDGLFLPQESPYYHELIEQE